MPPVRSLSAVNTLNAFVRVVNGDRADRASHLQPFRNSIDRDDLSRTQHKSAGNGELADRSTTPHCHRVALLDLRVFCRHIARGEDVGEKQDFFVCEIGLEFEWPDICKRDADVLRLAARISAHQVGIAKETGTGISVGGFHQVSVGIGVIARSPDLLLAELATTACNGERVQRRDHRASNS